MQQLERLAVPDAYTDVTIGTDAVNDAVVDVTLNYSNDFNDTARAASISLTSKNLVLRNQNDYLRVSGNISINGGKLNMSNGNLTLQGNWTNQHSNGFSCGNGKVIFDGYNLQTIENQSVIEEFHSVELNNSNGIQLKSSVLMDSLNLINGNLYLDTANLTISHTILNADESKYIICKNDKSSAGLLIMKAGLSETLFPIGISSSYNPCYISNTTGTEYFKARVFENLYENGLSGSQLSGDIVNRS